MSKKRNKCTNSIKKTVFREKLDYVMKQKPLQLRR